MRESNSKDDRESLNVYPRWPGGDEDGGEEEQGEHQSHGDQAQPGDEQGQTGFHRKFVKFDQIIMSDHR